MTAEAARAADFGRTLERLNVARTVAVTTLLFVSFTIELVFAPSAQLRPLYVLSAAVYVTVLLYATVGRKVGGAAFSFMQVAGDALLVLGFVVATGGSSSPLSFLFALPVVVAAGLRGLRGGVAAGVGVWVLYAGVLGVEWYRFGEPPMPVGQLAYATSAHLLGFVMLGTLGGMLGDRLHRKDVELEMRRSDLANLQVLHAHIVQSITTGLMTTDRKGRVTFVNRAGSEILQRPDTDTFGLSVRDLLNLPQGFMEEVNEHLRDRPRYRFERVWVRPADAEALFLGFSISSLKSRTGEALGWLVVFQDLTEIASLEEQVRTRERMAALGEMAAGMAHELRNPLAAITGCVQMIAAPDKSESTLEAQRLTDVVLTESRRLNRIIEDFLRFARPTKIDPQPCDLVPLMEELAALLRNSPEFLTAHEVIVNRGPGSTFGFVDADCMRQIFWNLASNALKSMPNGGHLRIDVSGQAGAQVQVTFQDEGFGMDQETARRLFQPFHTDFEGGTGLGAAIVYRIVEAHGGHVELVSREGRGTLIRILLPAAERTDQVHEIPGETLAAVSG